MKSRKATIIISVFVAVFIAIIATVGVFSIKQLDLAGFGSIGVLLKKPQLSTESSNSVHNSANSNITSENNEDNGGNTQVNGGSTDISSGTVSNHISSGNQAIGSAGETSTATSSSNKDSGPSTTVQNSPKTENVHKHSFSAATCTKPATCSCGQTTGTVINHSWVAATCTTAQKCKMCGRTQGEALGHRFDCWNKAQCTRCYIDNPAIPTPNSFNVVYESRQSTYNGCTVEIGDYYFSDLRNYLVGEAFFHLNIKVIASGTTGAVKVEFYDNSNNLLTYKTPSIYSGFGLTVGETNDIQCRIPEGARKIVIKGI